MARGKRRYNVRFAPKRIKKIMQKNAEVGRVAQAVPVMISKALEMFIKCLLTKTRMMMTQSKRSAVLSLALIKQCIDSENLFHFLEELAEHASSLTQEDARTMSMWSLYRTKQQELCVKKQIEVGEKASKPSLSSLDNNASSSDMESELYICL